MSVVAQPPTKSTRIPARILVLAGSNLLAEALANALGTYGFASRHIVPRELEIGRGIEWRPNLVLIDAMSLDTTSGTELTRQSSQAGFRVCVIDALGDGDRSDLWTGAGASAVIDRGERFDELFMTVIRLLRTAPMHKSAQGSSASRALTRPQIPDFSLLPV